MSEAVLRPRVGVEAMAGRWMKTSDGPQWIERLTVDIEGDALRVTVHGGTIEPSPRNWGSARSQSVYAGSPHSGDALAGGFLTRFSLDGFDVELQANLNLGLLVVATFVAFREPGPRANRFTREFFRREAEADA